MIPKWFVNEMKPERFLLEEVAGGGLKNPSLKINKETILTFDDYAFWISMEFQVIIRFQ